MRLTIVETADARDNVKTAITSLQAQIQRMKAKGDTPSSNPYLAQLHRELEQRRKQLDSLPKPATAAVEETAAWWDDLSPEQKRQYIKDHPNSKYAKEAIKDKPAAKKTGAAPEPDHAAAAKKHGEDLAAHVKKHRKDMDAYNALLDRYEAATGRTKKNLELQLIEMEANPIIAKALDLRDAKKAAEKKAAATPKPAAKTVPAKTPANADKVAVLEDMVSRAKSALDNLDKSAPAYPTVKKRLADLRKRLDEVKKSAPAAKNAKSAEDKIKDLGGAISDIRDQLARAKSPEQKKQLQDELERTTKAYRDARGETKPAAKTAPAKPESKPKTIADAVKVAPKQFDKGTAEKWLKDNFSGYVAMTDNGPTIHATPPELKKLVQSFEAEGIKGYDVAGTRVFNNGDVRYLVNLQSGSISIRKVPENSAPPAAKSAEAPVRKPTSGNESAADLKARLDAITKRMNEVYKDKGADSAEYKELEKQHTPLWHAWDAAKKREKSGPQISDVNKALRRR